MRFLRGGVGVQVRHTFTHSLQRIPGLHSRKDAGPPASCLIDEETSPGRGSDVSWAAERGLHARDSSEESL